MKKNENKQNEAMVNDSIDESICVYVLTKKVAQNVTAAVLT